MIEPLREFARQGRSFYFASRFLSPAERSRVASVYAYCRTTDDLVDEAVDLTTAAVYARLDRWLLLSRAACQGTPSGVAVIDAAMRDMREHDVPFTYAEQLVAGVRMDIEPRPYADFAALSAYTYRVAGVVGLWMSAMFGVREPWLMERAVCLGRAMQLTNIVRDVGEDWDRERLYLPESLLRTYGLTPFDIDAMRRRGRPITPAYRAVLEAMMTTADADYRRAFEAMPELPPAFRRTVAVAAEVYRGIHAEVRRAGYDTIARRAVTSLPRKCVLALEGLRRTQVAGRQRGGSALADIA
jgi:phytoene synthase